MNNYYDLLLEILKEIEQKDNNVRVAGGKGYAAGKAYPDKTVGVLKMLGRGEGENKEEDYKLKPVKISKAFKRRKSDNWLRKRNKS